MNQKGEGLLQTIIITGLSGAVVTFLATQFPWPDLPVQFSDGLTWVLGLLLYFNDYIAVYELLQVFLFILIIELSLQGFRIAIKVIQFVSGRTFSSSTKHDI